MPPGSPRNAELLLSSSGAPSPVLARRPMSCTLPRSCAGPVAVARRSPADARRPVNSMQDSGSARHPTGRLPPCADFRRTRLWRSVAQHNWRKPGPPTDPGQRWGPHRDMDRPRRFLLGARKRTYRDTYEARMLELLRGARQISFYDAVRGTSRPRGFGSSWSRCVRPQQPSTEDRKVMRCDSDNCDSVHHTPCVATVAVASRRTFIRTRLGDHPPTRPSGIDDGPPIGVV
jgi:hypothetical protein